MKNRNLYELTLMDHKEAVQVCRLDNNYGVQGYVFKNGTVRKSYTPYSIPQYIIKECYKMLNYVKE